MFCTYVLVRYIRTRTDWHHLQINEPLFKLVLWFVLGRGSITAGRDCGLAEWIIDDSCLVSLYFQQMRHNKTFIGTCVSGFVSILIIFEKKKILSRPRNWFHWKWKKNLLECIFLNYLPSKRYSYMYRKRHCKYHTSLYYMK